MSVTRVPSLSHLEVIRTANSATLDLSALRWIDPLHLTGVAAIVHAVAARGERIRVLLPKGRDPFLYAARMRLGLALTAADVPHNLPRVRERRREDDLLELTEITNEDVARKLAALVSKRVRVRDGGAASALYSCVFEMANNAAEHSGATGFVAAQTLPRAGVVRFAIADAGTGLLGTLRSRDATDDHDATRKALSGVSSLDEPGRGQGFRTTLDEVTRHAGHLDVASGAALTRARSGQIRALPNRTRFEGTLVVGTLQLADAR